jgi:hypothetical protein
MKIIITESQYEKILSEIGNVYDDPKEWYDNLLNMVDNRSDLVFDNSEYEVIVYDRNDNYLGYYDKEKQSGIIVNKNIEDEEIVSEEEETTGGSTSSTASVWPLKDVGRGPANPIDSSPWSVEPARGPANQLT